MQVTLLLGPAGSGKTFRCLAEMRAALQAAPEGPPLLLLAPKQATFQLERQLLADPNLPGYTRLQILSFERLAEFILSELSDAPPSLLGDEGRVMVLRALLAQRQPDLRLFRATARLPGFAQQLSLLLRELQRHQLSPARLAALGEKLPASSTLRDKLHDLSLLLGAYLDWLKDHQLQDANCLLDLATTALRNEFKVQGSRSKVQSSSVAESGIQHPASGLHLSGLWLDGFAEMTPQELDLLAAVVPCCDRATLAFCLEYEPTDDPSWLSTWSVVGQTFRQCHQRLASLEGCKVTTKVLERCMEQSRFSASPTLAHLEQSWTRPEPASGIPHPASDIHLAVCANPGSESILAAREILRHVHAGGRFRDCAVLVRSLDGYDDALRRVFNRYEIPFFLDRREPVSHHPLAELTRSALRVAAFGWKHDDWFGALKTGLVPAFDDEIDRLENDALAHGWEGKAWREPLQVPDDEKRSQAVDGLRQRLIPPFVQLCAATAAPLTGTALGETLRELWSALNVERRLDEWSAAPATPSGISHPASGIRHPTSAVHSTVWQQMQDWLANLERAFPPDSPPLPLREWLPILEAGLAGLTVGVIPPALDQVLVGTIDRSRNPDLQLALVLGLNEGVFPAPPAAGVLLTDADRDALENLSVFLGPNRKLRLGHERYFGYIACTRARRRLVLAWSAANAGGQPLNPSPFITQIRAMFPGLEPVPFSTPPDWRAAEHANELLAPLLQSQIRAGVAASRQSAALTQPEPENGGALPSRRYESSPSLNSEILSPLAALPQFAPVLEKARQLALSRQATRLSPGAAEALYGPELRTSVSRLEDYSACPFKFFIASGLRAEERKEFEIDARETGTFQHEALKLFHWRLRNQGRRWRDVSTVEACVIIRQIGEDLQVSFGHGLFNASDAARFQAEILITQLERLIDALIGWARQYEFDPAAVEVDFGFPDAPLPAWRLPLDDHRALLLRGRIDRIDFGPTPDDDAVLAAVIDYKSSVHPLDATKLHHGLQLQLLSYLGVLRHLAQPRDAFSVEKIVPAGVFYVGLRAGGASVASRDEVSARGAAASKSGYQHTGRFNAEALPLFDNRPDATRGDQFKFQINQDGSLGKRGNDALPPEEFQALLDAVEEHLRRIGREVLAGETSVSPYRKGKEIACQFCDYRAVCRFDPWVEPYRVLRPPAKE